MQKNHRGTVGLPGLRVSDIEKTGIDLFMTQNDVFVPRLDCTYRGRTLRAGLRVREINRAELGAGDGQCRRTKEATAMRIDSVVFNLSAVLTLFT